MPNDVPPTGEPPKKLRVLMLHSAYRKLGGEDVSARVEAELMASAGHEVELAELDHLRDGRVSDAAIEVIGGRRSRSLISRFRPEIVHVQNFFPLIPPQVFDDAEDVGAATVMSLRNYRIACLAGTHHRDGQSCTKCTTSRIGAPAIVHGCYQDSRLRSIVGQLALGRYRRHETWTTSIDGYIAVSQHVADALSHLVPADRVVVKPNSISEVPDVGTGSGQYALAVGRLSEEKGMRRLAEQWASHPGLPMLRLVGEGPEETEVRQIVSSAHNVTYVGGVDRPTLFREIADARFTIVPSVWNEPFGRIVIESFAVGTPVLWNASPGTDPPGGLGDHLEAFHLDDPNDLARVTEVMFSEPAIPRRAAARKLFQKDFAPDVNRRQLNEIYDRALERRRRQIPLRPARTSRPT